MSHRSRAISFTSLFAATVALTGVGLISGSSPAHAQNYREMSCEALWFARNQIYADYGYCFKTRRAIREFGHGCFPPYGRLPRGAEREVEEIKYWERRNDCDDD
jgi:hypothetical protein